MKIIFDSKEQKRNFMNILARGCPVEVGLEENEVCCDSGMCYHCWEKSGLEMEVVEKGSN